MKTNRWQEGAWKWMRTAGNIWRRSHWHRKAAWIGALAFLLWFAFALPRRLFPQPTSFVLLDANGQLLSASVATDGQWRFPHNDSVPPRFAACITTFEDKRFYYHPGIDPLALSRAIGQNLGRRRRVSGASTLTMQVVRLYSQQPRHFWNKLVESLLALRLELRYRKSSILALYASNAPFGSNVVGLDAAAWRYYGRPAADLSWGEMAALAVLPNAPALVHPGRNRQALLNKRNRLLKMLEAAGEIDANTAALAAAEPLPGQPRPLPQLAPHLLEKFRADYAGLQAQLPDLPTGIYTSLQAGLQQQVTTLVQRHAAQLQAQQIRNAAAVVIDVPTGQLLSYVGNVYQPADSNLQSHVDVLTAPRSPGSTLKPLLYAAMVSEGSLLPHQLVPDIPTNLGAYSPQNFDLGYDGAVPASRALARSLNVPAVRMLQQYKYARFYDLLKQEGITTLNRPADHYGLSLILGGCEVKPLELAGIYARLAHEYQQQGQPPFWTATRYLSAGRYTLPAAESRSSTAFTPIGLWHCFHAMNEVMRPGEEGLWGLFGSAQRIAWKTGTSFGFRDGWAVGVTGRYCVLVWAGNTTGEGSPALTGIQAAAPLLFQIFRLLPAASWFRPPATGIRPLAVCTQSGYQAGPDCAQTDSVWVAHDYHTGQVCPFCRRLNLDAGGHYQVSQTCVSPGDMRQASWFVLPPTMDYYYRQSHPQYRPAPPFAPGCAPSTGMVLDLVYPQEGARVYIPKELSGQRGRVVFTAAYSQPGRLFWHLDDAFAGTTERFHQLETAPSPGAHVLTVVDAQGRRVSRRFTVMEKE